MRDLLVLKIRGRHDADQVFELARATLHRVVRVTFHRADGTTPSVFFGSAYRLSMAICFAGWISVKEPYIWVAIVLQIRL